MKVVYKKTVTEKLHDIIDELREKHDGVEKVDYIELTEEEALELREDFWLSPFHILPKPTKTDWFKSLRDKANKFEGVTLTLSEEVSV